MSYRQRKRYKPSAGGRSTTGRSNNSMASSVADESSYIVCAISENLARETCVVSLDARAPLNLQAAKQGNGQAYSETVAYLQSLEPDEVLLNEGRRNSQLVRKVLELFSSPTAGTTSNDGDKLAHGAKEKHASSTVVKFISRACFDQTKGSEALAGVARDDSYDGSVVSEYIVLSSVHAVLHYTQQNLGTTFLKKSVRLSIGSGGGSKMFIDRSSLLQLELLANAKSGKTKNSIIAAIDHTKTSVGERLLRVNIMAPPTRLDTISARLDLVDAFLADKKFFYTVMEHLQSLPCLDKMITNVAMVPKVNHDVSSGGGPVVTKTVARKGISALVNIKTTLAVLPAFTKALEERLAEMESQPAVPNQGPEDEEEDSSMAPKFSLKNGLGEGPPTIATSACKHHLLKAIIRALENEDLKIIFDTVSAAFTNSTTSAHRTSHAMQHEECFALRAESTSMLSVVRKAYLGNVDDIYECADNYAKEHGLSVSVRYSSSRGYYLTIPNRNDLPPEFIHPVRSGRVILCTTEEVMSLSSRANDNVQDLLIMTNSRIQKVLDVVRSHYDALAALSDAIALLDMCHSFADCVTQKSTRPWCRPILTDSDRGGNGIVIRNGRYMGEAASFGRTAGGTLDFVANDTYATDATTFTIITGINGSGKSTYLKQIAIIVVLAHCGGYVPAEFASIPIRDWLCTRIGNTDDQEQNISTFLLEMKEIAFICKKATSKSLVLIDELGRATSNEDGVALAWAVAENLLQKRALTFFVTHYSQVTSLGSVYSSVQNQHLAATVARGEKGKISYTHKVSAGPCSVAGEYGVDLACACGWPEEIIETARQIETSFGESSDGNRQLAPATSIANSWCRRAELLVNHILASTATPPAGAEPLEPKIVKEKLAQAENHDENFRAFFRRGEAHHLPDALPEGDQLHHQNGNESARHSKGAQEMLNQEVHFEFDKSLMEAQHHRQIDPPGAERFSSVAREVPGPNLRIAAEKVSAARSDVSSDDSSSSDDDDSSSTSSSSSDSSDSSLSHRTG